MMTATAPERGISATTYTSDVSDEKLEEAQLMPFVLEQDTMNSPTPLRVVAALAEPDKQAVRLVLANKYHLRENLPASTSE